MQFSTVFTTLLAAVAVTASAVPDVEARAPELESIPELQARDTCGAGYGGDQRRTNSPCKSSNGDRHFCGCDRTGVVECKRGKWTEVKDCRRASCHGTNQGAAVC